MAGRPGVRGGAPTRGFPLGSAQAVVALVLGLLAGVVGLRRGEVVPAVVLAVAAVAAVGGVALVRLLGSRRAPGRVVGQHSQPQEDPMAESHSPADDIVYDLVSVQYHALKAATTNAQYMQDAEGHDDVLEFFRTVQQQDSDRAVRAHELLGKLTKGGIG